MTHHDGLTRTAKLLMASMALTGIVGLAQGQTPGTGVTGRASSAAGQPASSSTSKQLHDDMMSGMMRMHEMKPSGDADKDFAHMMEHHHEQAVKMTQTYLKGAKDPQLKAWAQKSLQNQQKELAELKKISPKE